jgi:V/A-type H+-transporting ATPase subunit I
MSKVQVIGPRRLLPVALRFLQARGVLQLRSPSGEARAGGTALLQPVPLEEGPAGIERSLAAAADGARRLLAVLPSPGAAPALPERLPDVGSSAFHARLESAAAELRALEEQRAALREERELVERYGKLLAALAPLRPSLPGSAAPRTLGLVLKPDSQALSLLEQEARRLCDGAVDLQWRAVDPEHLAVLLTIPRDRASQISALLFEQGVEEIRLPGRYAGQPLVKTLRLVLGRAREIPGEILAVEGRLAELAARLWAPLRRAERTARDRLARLRAMAHCGETGHAFVVAGWVPSARLPGLTAAVARAFRGRVTLLEHPVLPGEEEEIPVVLSNPPWLRPFERLLALVPPPRYGSIDPTPFLAFFFPLFFGIVLGDAAFGLAALALALVARRRGWGGALGRDLAAVAVTCAVSSLVFGVLFGEALGELGAHLGMRPLLLDRRRASLTFLGLTLAIGVVHVLLGLVLGVFEAARAGHVREALARSGRLGMLVSAGLAIGAAARVLSPTAGWVALAAVGAFAVLAMAGGGPMAILELVLGLGNVMSYARLMALGLASVMLAEVANGMATLVHPAALGVGLAIVLHAVNFTLGLVSPVVASLRLHYVEFFEKFYEGGGAVYRPFALES